MTGPLLFLAIGAALAQPAAACPSPAHVVVEVVPRLDPVRREVLGLAAIEDLRDRFGRAARHRTFGFLPRRSLTRFGRSTTGTCRSAGRAR